MLENTKIYIDKNKEIKSDYKNNIDSIKIAIKENKKNLFLSDEERKDELKALKEDLNNVKKEYKNKKKELQKPISFYIMLFVVIALICGIFGSEIYLMKNHRNYENDYFAFSYNKERIFITDYTEIANMWLVTTGGGLYAPSSILIGYTQDAEDLEVEYALYAMQERLGGTKSEEESEIKASSAYDNYILTLDNGTNYRILSKSIKKKDKILTVLFVNAGDLLEEEQAYLYQVYDTIKLN